VIHSRLFVLFEAGFRDLKSGISSSLDVSRHGQGCRHNLRRISQFGRQLVEAALHGVSRLHEIFAGYS
jgi:hypothetical protein